MRSTAWLALAILPSVLTPAQLSAQKKPFDAAALLRVQRLSDPQLSPDGRTVAFQSAVADMDGNRTVRSIWTVPLEGNGAMPHKLAEPAERPRWSADGKSIFYVSSTGGSSQIWSVNPDGSGQRQVTHLATDVDGEIVSADGKYLVVTSNVYPECGADDACNRKLLDAAKKNPPSARLITGLLYRHWNAWEDKTVSHLLSISLLTGKAVDLTPGKRPVPVFALGEPDDYAISPDGKEVCYAMNQDEVPAAGTNSDLFVVPVEGGVSHKITGSPGADSSPRYSPDGRYLAYRSQARGGYESDRWRLAVLERASGKLTLPTDAIDRSVRSFAWAPDSTRVFFGAIDRGHQAIQFVGVEGGGTRIALTGNNTLDDMQFTPDGKTMIFTRQSGSSPVEICRASSSGQAVPLTHLNDELLGQYELTALEEFRVKSADGAEIQSFVVKPPGFSASRKYAVLLLIHGGPEGEWGESWSARWNAQVLAGAGYVVVMPNPRGSIGYGQKFTEDIAQDWGRQAVRRHHGGDGLCGEAALRGCGADGGGGRLLRRLHGGLDAGPHGSFQGVCVALRRVRSAGMGGGDRGAVVPGVGVRRDAVGQRGGLRQMVAEPLCEGLCDADAGDPGRAGFPRAVHAKPAAFHGAADAQSAVRAAGVSR